jgi:GTPase SAR1 family protein
LKNIFKHIDKEIRHTSLINIPYYLIKDFLTIDHNQFYIKEFWLIVGKRGAGKTLLMNKYLYDFKEKYGDNILVASNYRTPLADFQISGWQDFLKDYPKPIIFAIDEIQNEFMSRNWQSFPEKVFYEFTQTRKNQKMMIATAQYYDFVDKAVRFYSDRIIEPKGYFNRFYRVKEYDNLTFERKTLQERSGLSKKLIDPPLNSFWYIGHDEIRNLFDTFEMIKQLRKLEQVPMKDVQKTYLEPNITLKHQIGK